MQHRARWRALLATVVLALPLASVPAATAKGAYGIGDLESCAPLTQSAHGTIYGSDGNLVNATVALTFIDWTGHEVDRLGCPQDKDAVGVSVSVNYMLPTSGAAPGPTGDAGVGAVATWSVTDIPVDVAAIQLETYPREQAATARELRHTDLSHYARSMRHFSMPYLGTIHVVLPRDDRCGPHVAGTSNVVVRAETVVPSLSGLRVTSYRLQEDPLSHVNAFSALRDHNNPAHGTPVMGLSLGTVRTDARVLLSHIASSPGRGQPYTMFYTGTQRSGQAFSTDYAGRQTFGVRSCHAEVASILEMPTNQSPAQRHQLQDLIAQHVHEYLLTDNT